MPAQENRKRPYGGEQRGRFDVRASQAKPGTIRESSIATRRGISQSQNSFGSCCASNRTEPRVSITPWIDLIP